MWLFLPLLALHLDLQFLLAATHWSCFLLFFDDTLTVTEYAKLCLESEGKQSNWHSTEEEIRAYLGFHILMGLNHKPEIRDYWSRDEFLYYALIASHISRDRFEEISRYFHFVSNDCSVL